MSGAIEIWILFVIGIALIAMATDFYTGKIYNWLSFSGMAVGLVLAFVTLGWDGFLSSLLGIVLAFLLYGWMFWFGIMGAGDVKLLMAFGALGGARYCIDVALLAILMGGAIGFVVLLFRGRLFGFLKRMYYFLLTVFVRELEVEAPKVDRSQTLPFGVALSAASIWVALSNPIASWGVGLWH